ncbi:MAG: hypothetical protein L0229_03645 [Blastocatellia bacterium]|nr:hypothetical protein [Blastocatellia bacterium]
MLKKFLVIIVVSLCLVSGKSGMALCQSSQTDPVLSKQAQEVKKKVEKIAIGGDISVRLPSGKELYGTVSRIEDESFEIAEVDLKRIISIKYSDVKKVWKGYGGKGLLSGKRPNPRTSKIWFIAVIGVIFALAAIGLNSTK